jgi:hypothetical protein
VRDGGWDVSIFLFDSSFPFSQSENILTFKLQAACIKPCASTFPWYVLVGGRAVLQFFFFAFCSLTPAGLLSRPKGEYHGRWGGRVALFFFSFLSSNPGSCAMRSPPYPQESTCPAWPYLAYRLTHFPFTFTTSSFTSPRVHDHV